MYYSKNMEIINQRKAYLENRKRQTRKFWVKVVNDYNSGISAADIAAKYTNPRTGKSYSRQHIHMIIRFMRSQL